MTDRIQIIRHEPVPKCGSYEVRFPDGRPSKFFYWEDIPGRRLKSDQADSFQALKDAEAFAEVERSRVEEHSRSSKLVDRTGIAGAQRRNGDQAHNSSRYPKRSPRTTRKSRIGKGPDSPRFVLADSNGSPSTRPGERSWHGDRPKLSRPIVIRQRSRLVKDGTCAPPRIRRLMNRPKCVIV